MIQDRCGSCAKPIRGSAVNEDDKRDGMMPFGVCGACLYNCWEESQKTFNDAGIRPTTALILVSYVLHRIAATCNLTPDELYLLMRKLNQRSQG